MTFSNYQENSPDIIGGTTPNPYDALYLQDVMTI
jgi:hypothetical protein